MEKRGVTPLPSSQPEDRDPFAGLPALMGQWTEELNRRYFTKMTGLIVTQPGKKLFHPTMPWLTATVDGFVTSPDAVFEAKHVNPFDYDSTTIIDRYMPQLQHNCFVTGRTKAVLSAFVGNTKWQHFWVDFDPFWHADLLKAERAFWKSVQEGTPPDGWSIGEIPHPSIISMTEDEQWAKLSAKFKAASGAVKTTTEELRAMVPPRVKEARGHGLVIRRDKRGTARIYEEES